MSDVERWRGATDAKLDTLFKLSDETKNTVKGIAKTVELLQLQVTRLIVYSSFAAWIGSAVVSILVVVAMKLLTK